MKLSTYAYGLAVFTSSLLITLFTGIEAGWSFAELGLPATIAVNILVGILLYATGIAYLWIWTKLVGGMDLTKPQIYFYLWALVYGCTQGLTTVFYAPYVPNAVWLTSLLNGAAIRIFVPGLVVAALYIAFRSSKNNIMYE